MVYSVIYYAAEAVTRAAVGLALKIAERMQRRRMVEERRREERPASWGFFATTNPYGAREYTWVGRATSLRVSIPELAARLPIRAHAPQKPPTRLYFTFAEAASKDWFKEIEWLAEQAERAASERRGAAGAT